MTRYRRAAAAHTRATQAGTEAAGAIRADSDGGVPASHRHSDESMIFKLNSVDS
jgi:hypothetical protein